VPSAGLACLAVKEFAYIHDVERLPKLLKNVAFLKAFQRRHLEEILFSSCYAEYEPGETIMKEGTDGNRIYILLKGKLRVSKGGKQIAMFERSGEVFGEMALLGIERRTATVTARSKVVCLAIDQRFLNEIESAELEAPYYAALYGFLCRVLAARLQRATASLARLKNQRGKKK
jgi:CRP-like cAMP-binding protein